MKYAILRATQLVAVCLLGSACAGSPPAFGTRYPDNRDTDIDLLLQRIDGAKAHEPGNIAVGITTAPTKLYAMDLSARRVLWQKPIDAKSAPFLAGDLVVLQVGDEVVAIELQSGRERERIDLSGMALKAATGDGPLTVLVIGKGQGTFAKSAVLLLRDGSVLWRREVDRLVGVPAVVGSMVLVPWSNQFLSAIDVSTGDEFARVRVHDGVIAHALSEGGHVYIGSFHGLSRVTSSIGSGTLKGAGFFSLPKRELPGRPLLLSDAYTAVAAPAPESAQHRIALAWKPTAPDHIRIGLEGDNLYLVFYRFVYALSPRDYKVRWAYVHDTDIVGATAQAHGLLFADQQGRFGFLGAGAGAVQWRVESAMPSLVVRLPQGGSGSSESGAALSPDALAAQLMKAAQDPDSRLVPARVLAVNELASLTTAEATADLIELCDAPRLAPQVREQACSSLKERNIGADQLLTALARHAGYLEGTTSPPVGALAKAAVTLSEKRAVPLLVAHLRDPNTRASDLPALISALGKLGDPAAAENLGAFLRLYHADAGDEDLLRALELIPNALVQLQGPLAQPLLEEVMYDELGVYPVRNQARVSVDGLKAQQLAAETKAAQDKAAAEQGPTKEEPTLSPSNYVPARLSIQLIEEGLLPVRDALRNCLVNAKKPTYQARIVLAIEKGTATTVSVLPSELQACIEPLVRAQEFPRTKAEGRESLAYTLKR